MVLVVKNLLANAGDVKRLWFDPWIRKIPWKRAWQPTPVFLPGKSLGWRNLVGYSPRGRKESDTTKRLTHTHTHTRTHTHHTSARSQVPLPKLQCLPSKNTNFLDQKPG